MQAIIGDLVKNFTSIAGTFILTRPGPIRHLNGDLRALQLVSTAKPSHLSQTLLVALKILKERVETAKTALGGELQSEVQTEPKTPAASTSGTPQPSTSSQEDDKGPLLGSGNPEQKPEVDAKKRTPSGGGGPLTLEKQKALDEKVKLDEAYTMFLKTLDILVDMCEKKMNVQQSAAALAAQKQNETEVEQERKEDDEN